MGKQFNLTPHQEREREHREKVDRVPCLLICIVVHRMVMRLAVSNQINFSSPALVFWLCSTFICNILFRLLQRKFKSDLSSIRKTVILVLWCLNFHPFLICGFWFGYKLDYVMSSYITYKYVTQIEFS